MKEYAIETMQLRKTYKRFHAVHDVSLRIPRGEIFGLVGENGAGKSTLMKMLSGMSHPTSGTFRLFGKEPQKDSYVYHRVGTLIEEPGLLPNLSEQENMKIKAIAMGICDNEELKRLLKLCDIAHTGHKKVKSFSLGMKQRLAIAMTLIGNPDLLILDEPTNGIDPKGFEMIRSLLIRLSQEEGKTIFISSHLLEELSKVATCYGFMKNGKIVEQLTREQLEEKSKDYLLMRVTPIKQAIIILEEQFGIREYQVVHQNEIRIYQKVESADVIQSLVQQGIKVQECAYHHQSLEQYFLTNTGGKDYVESV